ncbi:MAG: hypothetical protein LBG83_00125 [Oscillospiraceae bacterium]|jgi:penicillin-binding protein 2|nr:hypothetical protein [Oscillospiraceae bacterium]
MNLQKLNARTGALIGLVVAVLFTFAIALVKVQLVDGKKYASGAVSSSTAPIPAARGVILDRSGVPLVTNNTSLSMIFEAPFFPAEKEERAALLASLIALFEENKAEWIDQLPIGLNKKGEPEFLKDPEDRDLVQLRGKEFLNLNPYATAADCMQKLIEIYALEEYDLPTARKIASVRYNMQRLYFNTGNPYTFAKNITEQLKSKVRENSAIYQGVTTEVVPVRSFPYPSVAPHILGRVGAISKNDYDAHKADGYQLNDEYGSFGIERAAESYLRGKAGKKLVEIDAQGAATVTVEEPAQQGDTVVLTIDKDLEALIQKVFPVHMQELSSYRHTEVPIAGAVVVMNVKTFEILACVSYPGFDITRYAADLSDLSKDPTAPLWNRALQGTYEPGSTIKLSVALAALQENKIVESSTVHCSGIYPYLDQQFHCPQVYLHRGVNVNVIRALVDSCNTFFYEMGRRLTYKDMNAYRLAMGLGQKTGVELPEEVGVMDSPEYRAKLGQQWYAGNNIQTAIGQGNLFTPIQMAVYCATVANGGQRRRAHFIQSIRKAGTGELVKTFAPELLGSTGVDKANYEIVRRAMRQMAESRNSATYRNFHDLPVQVACKTGTSQLYRTINGKSTKINNGIFLSFAPYDNPEICVVAVGEGCTAAAPLMPTARDVYQYYFGSLTQMEKPQAEGVLL